MQDRNESNTSTDPNNPLGSGNPAPNPGGTTPQSSPEANITPDTPTNNSPTPGNPAPTPTPSLAPTPEAMPQEEDNLQEKKASGGTPPQTMAQKMLDPALNPLLNRSKEDDELSHSVDNDPYRLGKMSLDFQEIGNTHWENIKAEAADENRKAKPEEKNNSTQPDTSIDVNQNLSNISEQSTPSPISSAALSIAALRNPEPRSDTPTNNNDDPDLQRRQGIGGL